MILSTTFTLQTSMMTDATFNFRLDTLIEEINLHPYKDEVIQLLHEQVMDDMQTQYFDD